jgi:hypothetical protein
MTGGGCVEVGKVVNVRLLHEGEFMALGEYNGIKISVIRLKGFAKAGDIVKGVIKYDGNLDEYYVEALE